MQNKSRYFVPRDEITEVQKKAQFLEALTIGNEKTVLKLLKSGTNVNSKDSNGSTPLHYACTNGHLHIVKLLLERGAELEAVNDSGGNTPLHNACCNGNLDVAKFLLNRGANIEARSQTEATPLICACYRSYLDVAKYLLDHQGGANIEATSKNGWTSLHWACEYSHFDVVKELLKRGANVHVKDNDGKIPLDYAKTDEIRNLFSHQNLSMNGQQNDKASSFYDELLQNIDSNHITLLNKMDKLSQLVEDVHEMKILYTMVMYCLRQNVVDMQFCKKCIRTGLIKTAETCTSEDAIVIYKIILKKANKDNIISDSDFFRYDNRAEVKRMSEADFIKDMKKAIEINTQRINNLEHRVDSLEHRADKMQNVICNVVEHIKYQRKIQASVGFISGLVNAFSFGVGGSLLKAFSKLTSNVVDFGDVEHMKEEIQVIIEHPDGTQEVTTAGYCVVDDPGKKLEEQFLMGVQMGAQMLGGQLIDKDFNKTLSAMAALGSAAALASFTPKDLGSFPVNSRIVIHGIVSNPKLNGKTGHIQSELINGRQTVLVDGYLKPVALKVSNLKLFHDSPISYSTSCADSLNNNDNDNNNEIQTTAPIIFPDAVLSEQDENKFLLHCAVKYGDIDEIKKAIASLAENINQCDSQGRTALDLAALTGQLEVIELISDHDGNFNCGRRPKMIAIAKKREPDSKRYLEQIHNSL